MRLRWRNLVAVTATGVMLCSLTACGGGADKSAATSSSAAKSASAKASASASSASAQASAEAKAAADKAQQEAKEAADATAKAEAEAAAKSAAEASAKAALEAPISADQPPAAVAGVAANVLGQLAVKGPAASTGYSRDLFAVWSDPDRNGCDARNDTLRRDLQNIATRANTNGCVVQTGTLNDPYTGSVMNFVRGEGTSSQIQIDHVVALANAWKMGAWQWDNGTREAFGNDPLNLLAVNGSANQQKSDSNAASWMPANKGFRCQYVARQIAVKAKYHLAVAPPELDAMRNVLQACPDEALPADSGVVALAPQAAVAANPQPAPRTQTQAPAPAEPQQAPAGACDIKGNISSSGERIYHRPGQRDYDKTKIDESAGEKMFCSTADAEANGWRAAKR